MDLSKIKKIRYIKLSDGGKWWQECKDKNILRLGFNSGEPELFDIAINDNWNSVKKYWADKQVGTPTQ
jgi:hypothetical protein